MKHTLSRGAKVSCVTKSGVATIKPKLFERRDTVKKKVLLFDIETAPLLGYTWGKWEQNVIEFKRDWYILSFACKWLGEKKVYWYGLPSFPGYHRHKEDDKALVKKLWEFFDEADVLIGHNGDRFDIKKTNTRFVIHKLKPPSPSESIDTLKIARSRFAFVSNKLDDVCFTLGIGRKLPHEGKYTWLGCMGGDPKAWATMERYNRNDVFPLLEGLYLYLRAWDKSSLAIATEGCPKCACEKFQKRGTRKLANGWQKPRHRCHECGHWYLGPKERSF